MSLSEAKPLISRGNSDPSEHLAQNESCRNQWLNISYDTVVLRADADILLPLYEECLRLGVPALVMSGPTTPDLALNDPFAVDVVARTFPKLPIVCCHGFYPRVADMVAVAFRNENVLVSPDMYLYVEAANGFMQDQLLFGSSYPFRVMAQGAADLRAIGLSETALEKVGSGNARSLFGLS